LHAPEILIGELENLSHLHFFLLDIGLWLLSDKAVQLLRERSYASGGTMRFYDLYSPQRWNPGYANLPAGQ
jgi:hypothetical protein